MIIKNHLDSWLNGQMFLGPLLVEGILNSLLEQFCVGDPGVQKMI